MVTLEPIEKIDMDSFGMHLKHSLNIIEVKDLIV
jgi:hypothetical protein